MRSLALVLVLAGAAHAAPPKLAVVYCDRVQKDKKMQPICDAKAMNTKKAFKPRGTETNVHMQASLKTFGKPVVFLFKITDEKGDYVNDVAGAVNADNSRVNASMTLNKPGTYTVNVVNYNENSIVYATDTFTIGADEIGARAAGNQAAGKAKLWVCKSVDDNWKPVGATTEWGIGKTFNVLVTNEQPFQTDFLGIVIHKQGDDGKDVEFVDEWQQRIDNADKARKYATTEGVTALQQPGKYSLYIIDWRKREVSEHNGNLTEYFAKQTLTVK